MQGTTIQNFRDFKLCWWEGEIFPGFNPLNDELNTICHLLALFGAHHILHVSRIRVKTSCQVQSWSSTSEIDRSGIFTLWSFHLLGTSSIYPLSRRMGEPRTFCMSWRRVQTLPHAGYRTLATCFIKLSTSASLWMLMFHGKQRVILCGILN